LKDRPEETATKDVLERLLGARLTLRDAPGAPPATHDFDMVRVHPVAAVEVTILTEEPDVELSKAMSLHGQVIESKSLRSTWWVEVRHSSQRQAYKQVRARLERHLVRLESAGVGQFHEEDVDPPQVVAELLNDLPMLHMGGAMTSTTRGRIYLNERARATYVSGANVNAVLEEALLGSRFDGERAKLDRSGAEERHLFVWIDWRVYPAWEGLCGAEAPAAAPALPREITDLWAAAHCRRAGQDVVVWWTAASAGWEVHRLPA
jgi:hypothetical protein